jgi:hypothetical protein
MKTERLKWYLNGSSNLFSSLLKESRRSMIYNKEPRLEMTSHKIEPQQGAMKEDRTRKYDILQAELVAASPSSRKMIFDNGYQEDDTKSSCEPVVTPKSYRRKLVDYTKCRGVGETHDHVALSIPSFTRPVPSTPEGMPTCHSLDATLYDLILQNIPQHEKDQSEERIDFLLKVEHKSVRQKSTRVSSLDVVPSDRRLSAKRTPSVSNLLSGDKRLRCHRRASSSSSSTVSFIGNEISFSQHSR